MSAILVEHGRMLTDSGWSPPGYLSIRDGRIAALGAGPAPQELRQGCEILSAQDMAVLPGFTNAHTHLSQTFMRGLTGGRPLLRWLKELIWPLQSAMTLEELRLAALLGLVENLRAGATHVVDHQKITHSLACSQAVCAAGEQVGLRLTLARAWADRGANAENPGDIIRDLSALFEQYGSPQRGEQRIRIASGPLTPWRASGELLQKTHALAERWGSCTHIHVSETQAEVEMTVAESGLRPVLWLEQVGILGPNCQVVHATWLDDREIEVLSARGAPVIHCPISNAVLGSGITRVEDMRRAGVCLRLGTDGPASNDSQDGFDNMKAALMVAHLRQNDPTQLSPGDVLEMAVAGKRLRVGAEADVILVNLLTPWAAPVQNIDSALVLSCHGSDVDTLIANGKILMRGGRLLNLDEGALLRECQQAVVSLRRRAGLA